MTKRRPDPDVQRLLDTTTDWALCEERPQLTGPGGRVQRLAATAAQARGVVRIVAQGLLAAVPADRRRAVRAQPLASMLAAAAGEVAALGDVALTGHALGAVYDALLWDLEWDDVLAEVGHA